MVRIPGFHPGGPGSIPGVGTFWGRWCRQLLLPSHWLNSTFSSSVVHFRSWFCFRFRLSTCSSLCPSVSLFVCLFAWLLCWYRKRSVLVILKDHDALLCWWWKQWFPSDLPFRQHHGGRVVKALDLRSNGSIPAWVRTPPVVIILKIVSSYFLPGIEGKNYPARPWRGSNPQSSDSKSDALSIRPQGHVDKRRIYDQSAKCVPIVE